MGGKLFALFVADRIGDGARNVKGGVADDAGKG